MRGLFLVAAFFLFVLQSKAQVDTVTQKVPSDTLINQLLKDTTGLKEAPEALKKLLDKITQEEEAKMSREPELEIDGLIIEETLTKSGNDFYDFFYRDWEPPAEARNYTIYIVERPFRLNMTMIEISINDNTVIQAFMQPRLEFVENLAAETVVTLRNYLQNYEQIKRDLEGDDRSGSGIF
jgi:curli production assembly/transport component CsgE